MSEVPVAEGDQIARDQVLVRLDDERSALHVEELEAEHGALPETPGVITGGGGTHAYLAGGVRMKSRNGLRPGIDLKGEGGYVIAPPSRHASGREYAWNVMLHPDEVPLAQAPATQ